MNPSYEVLFQSIRESMRQGIHWDDMAIFGLIILACVIFAFGLSWTSLQRRFFRRHLTYIWYRLLGRLASDSRRFSVQTPVAILLRLGHQPTARAATVDLSVGGMYLKTAETFEPNTSFEFILYFGEDEKIEGSGLVRWVHSYTDVLRPRGIGVEFIGLSEKDRNRIRSFLKRRRWARKYKGQ